MQSKVVRRRRMVLAGLVALSVILLTAYFDDSPGGPLGSMQRGAMEVLAPIQEGANRALKPVRDLFGWVGSTLHATGERDKLKKERDQLRQEVAQLRDAGQENIQMRGLLSLPQITELKSYKPVTARVIARSPNAWFATVEINKGTKDGVLRDQPVVSGEGLVGKVKEASSGSAVIALITDQSFGISAKAVSSGEPGTVIPAVGTSADLVLDLVPHAGKIRKGEQVITAGTKNAALPSLFPKGILIGAVTKVDEGDGELDRKIHIKAAADLRRLEFVQVLTK